MKYRVIYRGEFFRQSDGLRWSETLFSKAAFHRMRKAEGATSQPISTATLTVRGREILEVWHNHEGRWKQA